MTAHPDVTLQLTDTEQPAARDFISRKLGEFNHAMTGRADTAALDVYVTDPATGDVLGGLAGRTSLGVFFIDLFYLPESLRGDGFGSRLLREAEAARLCACGAVHDLVPGAGLLPEARLRDIRRSAVRAGRRGARIYGQGALSGNGQFADIS
ncbi:hypothetical protein SY91_05640 [Burkholderia cenocepacia]|nr:hypothetical protein SY91_05640 [Burkholderia cenocepacia]